MSKQKINWDAIYNLNNRWQHFSKKWGDKMRCQAKKAFTKSALKILWKYSNIISKHNDLTTFEKNLWLSDI